MNSVLLSVALFGLLTVILGEECDMKKVDGFYDCVFKKMEDDKPRWTPDLIKEKHEAMGQCFVSNGCEKPDFERDIFSDLPPNFQVMARKMKSDWESTPSDVKKCLFEDLKDEIKDMLNECLTHKKVPIVKDLPDGIIKKAEMMLGGGEKDEDKKMIEGIFTAKINVARSLRMCLDSKGEGAFKKSIECFQGVRTKYMFDKMCTDKKSCEKDKLDDTCVKRGDEIENACCKCNEEKRDETLKKMDELRKNPGADMDVVAEMMCEGSNVTEMMDRAKECYDKSKLSVPAGLKLLAAMHNAKNTPNAPKFQFNAATINTIQDVLMAMMDHEECYVCHGDSAGASNSTMF